MSVEELRSQVDTLFASQQYDAIISLLFENKKIANYDDDLLTIFFLCYIFSQEREAGENTIFSKGNTLAELLERFTRLKFLMCRLDFDVPGDNAGELKRFLSEYQVSPVELKAMWDYVVIHKDRVWEKIKEL